MRPAAVVILEGVGAALIVAGLALVTLWCALVVAGGFLLLAARAAEPAPPRPVRVVRR